METGCNGLKYLRKIPFISFICSKILTHTQPKCSQGKREGRGRIPATLAGNGGEAGGGTAAHGGRPPPGGGDLGFLHFWKALVVVTNSSFFAGERFEAELSRSKKEGLENPNTQSRFRPFPTGSGASRPLRHLSLVPLVIPDPPLSLPLLCFRWVTAAAPPVLPSRRGGSRGGGACSSSVFFLVDEGSREWWCSEFAVVAAACFSSALAGDAAAGGGGGLELRPKQPFPARYFPSKLISIIRIYCMFPIQVHFWLHIRIYCSFG
jgi:hypothetical protein